MVSISVLKCRPAFLLFWKVRVHFLPRFWPLLLAVYFLFLLTCELNLIVFKLGVLASNPLNTIPNMGSARRSFLKAFVCHHFTLYH